MDGKNGLANCLKKKVIGKKVPKRLVKSMTQTVMPNHRWVEDHSHLII